jgi:hypothetical protein
MTRALLIHWCLALAFTGGLSAQSTLHTIRLGGAVTNRVNVTFLAEGYTNGTVATFLADATNAANAILAEEPFASYQPYLNFYAIFVASTNKGSDHPAYGTSRNTYFNSSYDPDYDTYITIPTNSSGMGKVNELLTLHRPETDLPVVLVNDATSGASDGYGVAVLVSTTSYALEAYLTHEVGHVLANLGDEYDTPYPYPDIEEPNTTRETNRALVKWKNWIAPETPVPTPETAPYDGVIGLFEGAHYHSTGWYRPKLNCMMSAVGVPFCEVCGEALIHSFYLHARPIDLAAPTNASLVVTSSTQVVQFSVTPLQPLDHNLHVEWRTNGIPVPGATNAVFTLPPTLLPGGNHTVSARVSDATTRVRTPIAGRLEQQRDWQVSVAVPVLQLSSPQRTSGGNFAFRISGIAPQGFAVQRSTNLTSWASIATNTLTGGQYWFSNSAALPRQYYRAVTPPR